MDDLDVAIPYPANIDDTALPYLRFSNVGPSAPICSEPYASTMSGFIALTKLCKIAGQSAQLNGRVERNDAGSIQWSTAHMVEILRIDSEIDAWFADDVVSVLDIKKCSTHG